MQAAKTERRRTANGLTELKKKLSDDVAERVKAIGCHLFALRGVDGVTIREILDAAKVKNAGAIGYYFGSKENLVRQILVDGSRLIDARRGELLDAVLAEGRKPGVGDIVSVLVHAVTDQPAIEERRLICFTLMVSLTHRDLYVTTMFEEPNAHFSRCIAYLKEAMPPMPASAQHQRLMFMKSNMAMALARREAARMGGGTSNEWALEHTLRHYIQAETAMLAAPFVDDGSWPAAEKPAARDLGLITHDPL